MTAQPPPKTDTAAQPALGGTARRGVGPMALLINLSLMPVWHHRGLAVFWLLVSCVLCVGLMLWSSTSAAFVADEHLVEAGNALALGLACAVQILWLRRSWRPGLGIPLATSINAQPLILLIFLSFGGVFLMVAAMLLPGTLVLWWAEATAPGLLTGAAIAAWAGTLFVCAASIAHWDLVLRRLGLGPFTPALALAVGGVGLLGLSGVIIPPDVHSALGPWPLIIVPGGASLVNPAHLADSAPLSPPAIMATAALVHWAISLLAVGLVGRLNPAQLAR